ncbi:MAG: DNA ligase D [Alphaproteobacteria bacterium]|nr:DNA ligase D [Alphaproteobacteria bacterium]
MARPGAGSLRRYRAKRDFGVTAEPRGRKAAKAGARYLIQKHAARRLHYDFRLELDGVLKSWAVTRGPSLDAADKRLAVHVEDHPVEYGDFEGTIPKGEYGGGTVMLWDRGTWEPLGDPRRTYSAGRLKFRLHGRKLHGTWNLVRMGGRSAGEGRENWLLIKSRDDRARPGRGDEILDDAVSVKTGRTMDEIAEAKDAIRRSNRAQGRASAARRAHRPNPGGRKAALPDFVPPQLATRVDRAPARPGWLHEIKLDGYRIQARLDRGKVRLLTRTGLDWTKRFSRIAAALRELPARNAVVDGEVVVPDARGRSDFAMLQQHLSEGRQEEMAYAVFDLLFLDDKDLRALPLTARKTALRALVAPDDGTLRYSDHIESEGAEVYKHACAMALEGIVSKRAGRPYVSGRNADWVKSKCRERQELVIGGYIAPAFAGRGVGSLLLGYWQDGRLVHAGRVGTGFSDRSGQEVLRRLKPLVRKTSPFAALPAAARRGAIFVEPKLVCEIEFATWTKEGLVRQASFIGLRADKPARGIGRERVRPASAVERRRPRDAADEIAGVRMTHPDRVLYEAQGITKRQLAEYYVRVADRILPYVANRPLSLVRCPGGSKKECFYQKHVMRGMPDAIRPVPIRDSGGVADYVSIADTAGLVALVQFGVLEIHPWNARVENVDAADQLVIDLDPAPGLKWERVIAATREVKDRLAHAGLASFLKATGGKGLHVVAPLRPAVDWDLAREFTRTLAALMAADSPDAYIAKSSKAARAGRIFVDYLRNQRGATAIAPYSTRARPGASVAVPLAWSALEPGLAPDGFKIDQVVRRRAAPWKGYFDVRQTIDRRTVARLAGKT